MIELRRWSEENRSAPRKVLFRQRTRLSSALWQGGFEFGFSGEKSIVGMPEENQTHHWQKVFIARKIRIRAQGICARPQTFFDLSDVFHLSPPD